MDIKSFIKEKTRYLLMMTYGSIKMEKKTAFFSSFSGKQYSDSPRKISEMLHAIDPNIKIVWSVLPEVDKYLPNYVKIVRPGTMRALKQQACSSVWVMNNMVQNGTFKNRRTLYIQTWHGDRAFKKIGADAKTSMGDRYSGRMKYPESKICNFIVTASEFGKKMYRTAIDYHGKYIDVGIPRNDCLVNLDNEKERINKIRSSLGIPENVHIMLYAPTFRDHSKKKIKSDANLQKALDILQKNGEKWMCLVRAHVLSGGISSVEGDDRFSDVTQYEDMADLLMITDLLITDYSSSAQDFLITGKPVVLTQFDIDEYTSGARSLYYDPKETGFLIANNEIEFESIISNLDSMNHRQIDLMIRNYYGMHESGKSTKKVCEYIIRWIRK